MKSPLNYHAQEVARERKIPIKGELVIVQSKKDKKGVGIAIVKPVENGGYAVGCYAVGKGSNGKAILDSVPLTIATAEHRTKLNAEGKYPTRGEVPPALLAEITALWNVRVEKFPEISESAELVLLAGKASKKGGKRISVKLAEGCVIGMPKGTAEIFFRCLERGPEILKTATVSDGLKLKDHSFREYVERVRAEAATEETQPAKKTGTNG